VLLQRRGSAAAAGLLLEHGAELKTCCSQCKCRADSTRCHCWKRTWRLTAALMRRLLLRKTLKAIGKSS